VTPDGFFNNAMMKLLRIGIGWICFAVWVGIVERVDGAEQKLRVQLVWGTNEAEAPAKDLKPLDEGIRDKFLRQLRWKHYFVVKAVTAQSNAKEYQRLDLSEKCAVEIKELADRQMEVRIFSLKSATESKLVATRKVSLDDLRKGHLFVYGGDSKDRWDDAWLVVIAAEP
jgi:hypothetical protein